MPDPTTAGMDTLASTAPALSTTSDMPVVKKAVEKEEKEELLKEEKPKEQLEDKPEVKDEQAEKLGSKEEEPEKAEKKDETPAWQKREITKARNRQREAESRASTLEERLDKALTALEKAAREPPKIEAEPRPERSKYDDPDKYESDLVAWSARTAAKVTQAQIEKNTQEREQSETRAKQDKAQAEQQKELSDAWGKAVTVGEEKYPDYHEVAEARNVPITPAMAFSIMQENLDSGRGFEIAYYLGKHPEQAKQIASLPEHRQSIAIGRLAERLEEKPEKVSKAPPPPKPVGSKSAARSTPREEKSMEEYAKERNAQIRAERANPH